MDNTLNPKDYNRLIINKSMQFLRIVASKKNF